MRLGMSKLKAVIKPAVPQIRKWLMGNVLRSATLKMRLGILRKSGVLRPSVTQEKKWLMVRA
jgi:hypothetical protein